MPESPMVGWDFSRLDGRMWAAQPPWDFEAMSATAMHRADSVLDVGTGGGERLIRLLDVVGRRPPHTVATEGWPPNISIAKINLRPLDVDVVAYDPESDSHMPFPDAEFDLVMNRHEGLDPSEIFRVLRPGGTLLTQQVDGNELPELREIFGGRPAYPEVTLAVERARVEEAGLTVTAADEWSGPLRFADARALDDYLSLVPWDRPESFDPERLSSGEITLTQRRFWIRALR